MPHPTALRRARRPRPGTALRVLGLGAGLWLGGCSLPAAPDGTPAAVAARPACLAGQDDGGAVVGAGLAAAATLPEPSSGYRLGRRAATARSFMVVAAHPLATQAGCAVLAAGGSAADAAVAVQMVLGLVEPQSSGLGGGAFIVHFDAATREVQTYDGREAAPAAATANDLRWVSDADRRPPQPDPRASGRSIGTPGAVRALELLHRDHGRLAWSVLFDAGIGHATQGFAVGGRLADAIAAARDALRRDPDAAVYFLDADGAPRARGSVLRNPAYAETLRALAAGGADALHTGPIAAAIVAEIGRTEAGPGASAAALDPGVRDPSPRERITPGRTTLADLAGYRALRRDPACADYRAWRVCGMGPPSSGGIAVAQTLGLLSHFDLAALAPADVDGEGGRPRAEAVHLVSEALRLAFADRNRYVADTGFVPLPGAGVAALLDPAYLRSRAALIRPDASLGTAPPGVFDDAPARGRGVQEGRGTSHLSIVDAAGNAVSMTTTIESSLGSYRLVRGFLLNNQLTDFSFAPADADGPIANRLQAGKRPRSSMAPTLVFRRRPDGGLGELVMVTGAPGGAATIPYVVKTLVATLDWGLDAQQSAALVNFGAFDGPTTFLGGEHPAVEADADGRRDPLARGLRALGHQVSVRAQTSGVATILRVQGADGPRWQGGADPRREGLALGD